jgi:hypothetical protein
MKNFLIKLVAVGIFLGLPTEGFGIESSAPKRPSIAVQKPLEVRGEVRMLPLLMVRQADKAKLSVVKPRSDYRAKIITTRF